MMLKQKINFQFIFICLVLFAIFQHIAALLYSSGPFRPDEHLSAYGFGLMKWGFYQAYELGKEYSAEIRFSALPWLIYIFASIQKFFSLTTSLEQTQYFIDGQQLYFVGRLFSLFTSTSVYFFWWRFLSSRYHSILSHSSPQKRFFFHACFWAFYIFSFFHVRLTSENFTTLFYSLTLISFFHDYPNAFGRSFLDNNNSHQEVNTNLQRPFLLGLLCTLTFFFRFQSAFLLLPLPFLHFLSQTQIFTRKKLFYWMKVALSFFITSFFCVTLDRLFYGHWTLTPWNYFELNLLKKYTAHFGVTPWYYYFTRMTTFLGPIGLGLSLIFSVTIYKFYTAIKQFIAIRQRSLSRWQAIGLLVTPFILIHCLIGHKELRFLFPLIIWIPILIFEAHSWCLIYIQQKKQSSLATKILKGSYHFFIYLFILENFLLVGWVNFRASDTPFHWYDLWEQKVSKYRSQEIIDQKNRPRWVKDWLNLETSWSKKQVSENASYLISFGHPGDYDRLYTRGTTWQWELFKDMQSLIDDGASTSFFVMGQRKSQLEQLLNWQENQKIYCHKLFMTLPDFSLKLIDKINNRLQKKLFYNMRLGFMYYCSKKSLAADKDLINE